MPALRPIGFGNHGEIPVTSGPSTRAKAIAEAALQKSQQERHAFVHASCGADAELLGEVRSILAAGTEPSGTGGAMATHVAGVGRWGDLILFEEIGRGAFGVVYRAFDPTLERAVALKVLQTEGRDPAAVRRILHEGRLLARLKHPNVVTVFGAQHLEDQVGIWMELVDGRTLADIVHRDGPMGPEEAAVIGAALCSALGAVHAAGLVHRDVKARNVMRESGGRIVLMDFGAGSERISTPRFELAGTPAYMAPEVLRGEPASPASDVYSVGVLLYYLVAGRHPFVGDKLLNLHAAHERRDRRPLTEVRHDVPDWFAAVVEIALASAPADRYRSAAELRRALSEGVGVTPVGSPHRHAPAAEQVRAHPARRDTSIAAIVGTAIAVAGGILFAGFASSMAFNVTLGRTGSFAAEAPAEWFVWGLRALFAPAAYMVATIIAVILVSLLVRSLLLLWPRGRRAADRVTARLRRLAAGLGLDHPDARLQAIAAAGAVAIVLVCWVFVDVLYAATSFVPQSDPDRLAMLRPAHARERVLYGLTLDLIVLGLAAALYRTLRAPARGGRPPASAVSLTLAGAVMALALLLVVVPYRVLWQNEFERVEFGGARCYIIGEAADEVLLHCPDVAPPRNRVVSGTDARLARQGIIESIFTPAGATAMEPR